MKLNWLIVLFLSTALLFLVILEFNVVFRPLMTQLVDEENGTMILLKLIPSKIREIVPKISMYLDNGIVVDEVEEQMMHPRCQVLSAFMREFGTGVEESKCFKMLDKSKYVPLLHILRSSRDHSMLGDMD